MEKFFKLIFIFTLLALSNISLFSQCPHTPKCPLDSCYYGVDGSASSPFQIWTKAHLEELADSVNNAQQYAPAANWSTDKYFALMQDITDSVRTVIGWHNNIASPNPNDPPYGGPSFQGNFDGNGHKITASIYKSPLVDIYTSMNVGVFGYVSGNSVIKNLSVDGVVAGYAGVGGIVGSLNGAMIMNCNNYASLQAIFYTYWQDYGGVIGGIAGGNSGSGVIISCNNYANIENPDVNFIGGVVGNNSGDIFNCVNTGDIKGMHYVGGVIGSMGSQNSLYVSIVNFCVNIGNVVSNSTHLVFNFGGGGIAGSISNATISNSINYGFIYSNSRGVGGVLGWCYKSPIAPNYIYSTVSNNSNFGVVVGNSNVGCIAGEASGAILINNHYDKQMCGE